MLIRQIPYSFDPALKNYFFLNNKILNKLLIEKIENNLRH